MVLGARSVRAAALFCPLVEEPGREAGPAAMPPPPWGSEHGLYVVVVDAGGALMGGAGAAATTAGSHEAEGSRLSMGIPWTHRGWRRVPEKKGGVCFSHDPMPKGSATPRIALMI